MSFIVLPQGNAFTQLIQAALQQQQAGAQQNKKSQNMYFDEEPQSASFNPYFAEDSFQEELYSKYNSSRSQKKVKRSDYNCYLSDEYNLYNDSTSTQTPDRDEYETISQENSMGFHTKHQQNPYFVEQELESQHNGGSNQVENMAKLARERIGLLESKIEEIKLAISTMGNKKANDQMNALKSTLTELLKHQNNQQQQTSEEPKPSSPKPQNGIFGSSTSGFRRYKKESDAEAKKKEQIEKDQQQTINIIKNVLKKKAFIIERREVKARAEKPKLKKVKVLASPSNEEDEEMTEQNRLDIIRQRLQAAREGKKAQSESETCSEEVIASNTPAQYLQVNQATSGNIKIGVRHQVSIPSLGSKRIQGRRPVLKASWEPTEVNNGNLSACIAKIENVIGQQISTDEEAVRLMKKFNGNLGEMESHLRRNLSFYKNLFQEDGGYKGVLRNKSVKL